MTEDTGFSPVAEEPDETQAAVTEPDETQAAEPVPVDDQPAAPLPPVDADPQEVADEAAAAEPVAGNDEVPAAPDPDWLIDLRTQHPGSALLAAIEWLYQHLGG